ncbi:GNAT family N-acetyltransferase [Aestuariivivens sediminicola]|uniref:GNAT family N-acetyltransferase n=1 Tax=Aestuariivivens sediminicola TaxID=2913560 RepID=UPI001F5A9026|nr:GNAT family N-acetyltransferase [Aestuariivivens sediminicola]
MHSTNITYQRATTDEELLQILELQKQNLAEVLSTTEKEKEGFVTVAHSIDLLNEMNAACPHIIAKHGHTVIGYALCMTKAFKSKIPILVSMFNVIESLDPIPENYVIMGQVCIAKSARGQGVFRGLYHYMSEMLKPDFKRIITEVDVDNTRSSLAHKAVGFKVLKQYKSDDRVWELIGLEI